MSRDYWQEKWNKNDIAFHKSTPNELLLEYYSLLNLKPGQKIFVPLCGKTLDLLWLYEQGLDVVGVEFSAVACEAFFAEHELEYTKTEQGEHTVYHHPRLTLYAGDLFTLPAEHYQDCAAVYDRASLVALSEDIRKRYTQLFIETLTRGTQILLLTLSYPNKDFQGPPFSITPRLVKDMYNDAFTVNEIYSVDKEQQNKPLYDKGMTHCSDHVLHLTKK